MNQKFYKYLKRTLLFVFIIIPIIAYIGYSYLGARVHYDDNPIGLEWNNDGPYLFFENDNSMSVNYIKGNQKDGFQIKTEYKALDSVYSLDSYFALDNTHFNFKIDTSFKTPKAEYKDGNKILAISDIESGYRTFRDFLINSNVIDDNLNWIFGKGHLVLVGDFVDRGLSTTQVLWFIYKLEQDAKIKGGFVHYLIGNHELKNMHGNYKAASYKYEQISSILEKTQSELYNSKSFIGKWLYSKNAIELINGNLFVHGGIHPSLAGSKLNIEDMNKVIRSNYYKQFSVNTTKGIEQLLTSTKTGPCWYRGYFKNDLTQEEVEVGLDIFNAKTVIVGHTLQSKVNKTFNGKVIGIDVHHPKDYHKNWPKGRSEALLIEGSNYYRVFDNGVKEKI